MSVESPQSDADLLQAVRAGDAAAYGRLYERHVTAARALARRLVTGEAEVDDVVAESFTKILDLVGRGGGPESGFRTYLLTVVRRTVYDRSRVESRQVTTGEIELFDPGVPFVDPALAGLEKTMIARAFLSLPERWRAVLWHTEVEKCKPAEVAPLLGLTANGVAALGYRAREGLRQAYLQMHLGAPPRHACRPVLGKLGAYVRGGLARRDSKSVDEHVSGCPECHAVLLELTDVNRGLRVVIGPLIAGPAHVAYVAALAKAAAAGGGAAGLLRLVGLIRRVPRQQQAAMAGGAVTAMAVAVAFALVSGEEPVKKPAPTPAPVAQPPASVAPPPTPRRDERPRLVPPPAREEPSPDGEPRLRASIAALGALVRDQPGIVGMRLRNDGAGPSDDLEAFVDLPPGVLLIPSAARGAATAALAPVGKVAPVGTVGKAASVSTVGKAASVGKVGTVDGWSCRPSGTGARCARAPLGAGTSTAVFLRVLVSAGASEGAAPSVRINAGSLRLRARAGAGVVTSGAAARFATDGHVAVRAIGGALLSCDARSAGCAETRRRRGDQRDNDLWPMTRLDHDTSAATASSSAARLELPADNEVVWAGLYWSAGDAPPGPVRLRPPGRRAYLMIQPDQVLTRELPSGGAYQAFADVSRLVGKSRRSGVWWAADAPLDEGVSTYAGWSLVVIVADPRQPYSQAVVLDTATVIGGQEDKIRIPLGGLSPAAAPARVELVTWEGDADLKGDKVSLGSGALTPQGGDRDQANVFDGSSNGATEMTFGVDVDTVSAQLGPAPGLTIATDKDVVLFGVAAVSVRARS
ncbi:sigma-70 family RNA polymerase sigma factor [Nonomuraea sp. NN258]|uniref:sigma-70 family RNA polymerase sigma factor n=1 Tax=Nonomuraea antri TaxID=2730852 RepID=UPI001567F75B|nr:sigma-70 family RNA polymerase sigma factor [Nonomuraea antri]NRQ32331.1 sigma-70 family RNA polymerase sigma factor [Nonomuraea antri]